MKLALDLFIGEPYRFLVRKQASQGTGDSLTNATPIKPNSTTRGLVDSDRSDWLTFTSRAGSSHQAYLFSGQSVKVFLEDGTEVSPNDRGLFEPSTIDRQLFIEVSGDGAYELDLSTFLDDHGNYQSQATPITNFVNSPGAIQSEGDVDWFTFSVEEGVAYTVRTDTRFPLELIDSDGAVVGVQDGFNPISWTADDNATMFVRVADPPFESMNYKIEIATGVEAGPLDVAAAADDETEDTVDDHPNCAEDATPIDLHSTIVTDIETENDEDWFAVNVEKGTTYHLAVSSGEVWLYDADGENVLRRGEQLTNWTATSDKTIFLKATGFNTPVEFTFTTLESVDDHGNDPQEAASIEVGTTGLGTINGNYDTDWFSFNAERGTTYTLSAGSRVRLQLFEADGSSFLGSNLFPNQMITWKAPFNGPVFLEVIDDHRFNPDYEILLTSDKLGDDHGDSRDSATAISIPSSITWQFDRDTDVDWFSFEAIEGQTYLVDTLTFGGGLELLAPSGNTLRSEGNPSNGTLRSTIEWLARTSGTTFISLTHPTGFPIAQPRQLDISTSSVSDDHGNSSNLATPISIGVEVSGTTNSMEDADWFSFEASGGETYKLSTFSDVDLLLFDTDGETLLDLGRSISFVSPSDQPLFVNARGRFTGAEYEFVIAAADDHGDAPQTATTASVPSINAGEINSAFDLDFITFPVHHSQTYSIETDEHDVHFRLITEAGTTLAVSDSPFTGQPANIIWDADMTGDVYLEIRRGISSLASYDVRISAVDQVGDSADLATVIDVPSAFIGAIEAVTDSDWFSFEAEAGLQFSFDIDASGPITFSVHDDQGEVFLTTTATDETIVWQAAEKGKYFVEIEGDGTAVVDNYKLSVAVDEQQFDISQATSLIRTPVVAGNIDQSRDVDTFSFLAVEAETLQLAIQLKSLPASRLSILDSQGSILASDEIGDADFGSLLDFAVPTSGTFYVAVEGLSDSQGSYDLLLSTKISGDLNNDQLVDEVDIDLLCAEVHRDGSNDVFDLNGDAAIDDHDVTILVEDILDTTRGDTNLDGQVDFADFLRLLNNFGSDSATWADGDFNCDGSVTFDDFLVLAERFGR